MIRFKCEACGSELEADASLSGEVVDCAHCHVAVSVPDLKDYNITTDPLKALRDAINTQSEALKDMRTMIKEQTIIQRKIGMVCLYFFWTSFLAALAGIAWMGIQFFSGLAK